ncbi:pikachurin-like [Plakobranchus ocellatus]|uniref:Pikachurin-like n=1 Tax=Plakobranchus ocellatus TaxID=259542 RepID=A0AAV4CFW2_9GAST|nr:pikachurin-like [Plakobranchus ocellatus]
MIGSHKNSCDSNMPENDRVRRAKSLDDIYLGGYPDFQTIATRVNTDEGFYGCIKEIHINNNHIVFSLQHQHGSYQWNSSHFHQKWKQLVNGLKQHNMIGIHIAPCLNWCHKSTCLNGGECVELHDFTDTETCICLPGYSGDKCEKYSPVEVPHFSFNSSLEIPVPTRQDHHTNLRVILKASSLDGLILYLGISLPSSSGFLSLGLDDGHVVFKVVIVQSTFHVKIRSPDRINPNKWTLILATHAGDRGYLKVSHQAPTHFIGLAPDESINKTRLYLGRDPHNDGSGLAEARRSFTGCLHLVQMNNHIIDLYGPGVSGINIANCSVCEKLNEPCLNGGQCMPGKDSSYTCGCREPFTKTQCKDGQVLHFTGRNYVHYKDKKVLDRLVGDRTDVYLEIRTTCPNGLIFWSGNMQKKPSGSTLVLGNFLTLGFENGVLRLYYDLGAKEVQINYTETRLFDGNWHLIMMTRVKEDVQMIIDREKYVNSTGPGYYYSLDTELLYLGGMPDERLHTQGRFNSSFIGDIRKTNLKRGHNVTFLQQSHESDKVYQCG